MSAPVSPSGLALRLARLGVGLALVALVLWTQVRWSDRITLRTGEHVEGRVVARGDGYQLHTSSHAQRHVPLHEVAEREVGGRSVPAVDLGLPTLLSRAWYRPLHVVAAWGLSVVFIVLTAWRWRGLLRALGLRLSAGAALRLTWIGCFFNLAVPGSTGGDVVKSVMAARATGRATPAVLAVFVDRLLGLLALVLLAAAAVLGAPASTSNSRLRWLVGACAVLGLGIGLVLASRRVRRGAGLSALARRLPFAAETAEAGAGLLLLRGQPRRLSFALGISLAVHVGSVVAAWLVAEALGLSDLRFATLLVVVPLANLAAAAPLLPGGWGLGEMAYAWLLAPSGVEPTAAIGLSVLLRLLTLAASLPGGLLWMRGGRGRGTAAAALDATVATNSMPATARAVAAPTDAEASRGTLAPATGRSWRNA